MAAPPHLPRSADWFLQDAKRNEAARIARLRRDAKRPLGVNLEDGARLVKFMHEMAASFEHCRTG
jgi:hypothetical protein